MHSAPAVKYSMGLNEKEINKKKIFWMTWKKKVIAVEERNEWLGRPRGGNISKHRAKCQKMKIAKEKQNQRGRLRRSNAGIIGDRVRAGREHIQVSSTQKNPPCWNNHSVSLFFLHSQISRKAVPTLLSPPPPTPLCSNPQVSFCLQHPQHQLKAPNAPLELWPLDASWSFLTWPLGHIGLCLSPFSSFFYSQVLLFLQLYWGMIDR